MELGNFQAKPGQHWCRVLTRSFGAFLFEAKLCMHFVVFAELKRERWCDYCLLPHQSAALTDTLISSWLAEPNI